MYLSRKGNWKDRGCLRSLVVQTERISHAQGRSITEERTLGPKYYEEYGKILDNDI